MLHDYYLVAVQQIATTNLESYIQQLISGIIVAAGIIVLGFAWFIRGKLVSSTALDKFHNKLMEDLYDQNKKNCIDIDKLQDKLDDQEVNHEADRSRWIEERNTLQLKIDKLTQEIEELRAENRERELIITSQSETIKSLQAAKEKLQLELNELRDLLGGKEDKSHA